MKIAVVGCGGNGGVVAGVLAAKKADVVCIDLNEEVVRQINDRGIHLQGKKGCFTARARAFTHFSREWGKFDIIVLGVKSMALKHVFMEARDYVSENGFILTLQNGIVILEIVEEFPDVKVVAGAVGYNSIMADHGKYLVTSNGGITAGSLASGTMEDILLLKSVLEPGIKIKTTRNIVGVLWSKLIIVCGVTGLGGVSGLLAGELLRYKVARKLFYQIVTEGACVAKRLGVNLEKVGGAINPEKFGTHKEGYPLFLRYLLLKIIGIKYKNLRGNIHQDLERGVNTEVDFINGEVVKIGDRLGIDTPVNTAIVKMVKEIEGKKRQMSVRNLHTIWDQIFPIFVSGFLSVLY